MSSLFAQKVPVQLFTWLKFFTLLVICVSIAIWIICVPNLLIDNSIVIVYSIQRVLIFLDRRWAKNCCYGWTFLQRLPQGCGGSWRSANICTHTFHFRGWWRDLNSACALCVREWNGWIWSNVANVMLPQNEYFGGYKQSPRRDDDIAIVNAGMRVRFEDNSTVIKDISLAFGGMAPTTVVARKTMKELNGKWVVISDNLCLYCTFTAKQRLVYYQFKRL